MLNLDKPIRRLSHTYVYQADLRDERFFDQRSDDCALSDALYNVIKNWLAAFKVMQHK